jgi:hypothetical protein
VDSLFLDSIDEVEASWLERNFEEWKVLEVVKAMSGNKAPGPDCYSMAFFQASWVVLKEGIMKVFCDFHTRCKFERNLHAMFIALIPKIPTVVDPRIFAQSVLWVEFRKLLQRF